MALIIKTDEIVCSNPTLGKMENGELELEKRKKSENEDEENKQEDVIIDRKHHLGGVRTMPFILG